MMTKLARHQVNPDSLSGANMPHLTTGRAAGPLDGAQPAEVETDEVPGDDANAVHQASPAKNTNSKTTGTARKGVQKNTRAKAAASNSAGNTKTTTAGRRKKLFDNSRAQAAYERVQDLKQSFSAVQKALKAPLNEIADRSISELLEDSAAMERTPEFAAAQAFLATRLEDQQRQVNDRHRTELAMARHVLDGEIEAVHRSTDVSIDLLENTVLIMVSGLTSRAGPDSGPLS